jgi:DNA mismatch endonuclease (patch repair protein)
MRGNRRRDTSPEMRIRSELHRRGWRYRVDLRVNVGVGRRPRPDIAFTRARVAVFVDGCFWHCCPEHGRPPLSNGAYWGPKLARNAQRDAEDTERLQEAGWSVVRVWEHVALEEAVRRVEEALGSPCRAGAG